MMKKLFIFVIAFWVSVSVFLISVLEFGLSVKAQENDDLKEVVIRATELMEELMDASYQKAEEKVKQKITEAEYDYVLTMESFYQQGNPFSEMDYNSLISACCVLIDHEKGNYIYDMDMLDVKYEENYVEEVIPVKVKHYVETEEGYFEEKGYRYLVEECDYPVYERAEDGKYIKAGTIHIIPKTDMTLYAGISFEVMTGERMITEAGLDYELLKEEHSQRIKRIEYAGLDTEALLQSVFIRNIQGKSVLSDEECNALENAIETAEGNEAILLSSAMSLVGNVPYEWGGKAAHGGYNKEWWSFGDNGKQKGLDCSGYMQWVYMTAGYPASVYQNLLSTQSILHNTVPIEETELEIGDFGLLNAGESVNHVGMYVGDGYFIHCSSYAGTVTVSSLKETNFRYFRKVDGKNDYLIQGIEVSPVDNYEYTDDEVLLMAQLMYHEARGEGLNGWIAVGEVVMNRIYSNSFPDTLNEVVYQQDPEQFENSALINTHTPTDDMIETAEAVLSGQIRLFNNPDVLYYRNPGDNDGDWGPFQYYQRVNNHVFYTQ